MNPSIKPRKQYLKLPDPDVKALLKAINIVLDSDGNRKQLTRDDIFRLLVARTELETMYEAITQCKD